MKRLLAIALISAMAFTMTACSSKSEEENIDNGPTIEEVVEEDEVTEEEVTEEKTEETSEVKPEVEKTEVKPEEKPNTSTPKPTPPTSIEKPSTPKPTTPKPTTPPTTEEKPVDTSKSGQLQGAYEATIAKVYEGNTPSFEISKDGSTIESRFGIEAALYNEALVAMPIMNVNVDTFIGFEAKDEKSAESIKAKLDSYKAGVIADREAFPYLPDHLPKAKAAKVVTKGNYVFYISMANISVDVEEDKLQEAIDAGVKVAVNTCLGAIK